MATDYKALQENNKLSALRQMAEGNPDPYAGSSSVISGAEQEALNRYTADAAGRGAPQGSISQGEAMIRAPAQNALGGLGEQGGAQSAALAALKAEAENAAAPNTGDYSTGSTGSIGSRRKPTREELQEAAGYKQYGGYNTSEEYNNAVLGRAQALRDQRQAEAEAQRTWYRVAAENAATESKIADVKALQAKNEAVVGGPGAVIHGIGWKQPEAPQPAPPVRYADPTGQVGVLPPGRVGPQPGVSVAPPPVRRLMAGPGTVETSNYTPEQVAMLRAASEQTHRRAEFAGLGPMAVQQTWEPRLAAIEDPRNIYEFAQRAAINELGGEPWEAIGRFSPEWAMNKYAIPRVAGPSEYQAAQNEAFEREANLAAGLGGYTDAETRSRRADYTRGSPDYQRGAQLAEAQLATLRGGPKSEQPVTLDGLRTILASQDPPLDPLAAEQLIKDYSVRYPGAGFYNQPEETLTAAATAGQSTNQAG